MDTDTEPDHGSDDEQLDADLQEAGRRTLDSLLAKSLSWARTTTAVQSDQPALQNDEEDDGLHATEFPLLGRPSHVRLLSPSALYPGPGKGRILAESEESKAVRKERRKRIADVAVDYEWLTSTSLPERWTPHPADANKVTDYALLPSRSKLPAVGFLRVYKPLPPKAPKARASPTTAVLSHSSRTAAAPELGSKAASSEPPTMPVDELQRGKISAYPLQGQKRLSAKIMKERHQIVRNPKKRKSKRRREYERLGKAKLLPGMTT